MPARCGVFHQGERTTPRPTLVSAERLWTAERLETNCTQAYPGTTRCMNLARSGAANSWSAHSCVHATGPCFESEAVISSRLSTGLCLLRGMTASSAVLSSGTELFATLQMAVAVPAVVVMADAGWGQRQQRGGVRNNAQRHSLCSSMIDVRWYPGVTYRSYVQSIL